MSDNTPPSKRSKIRIFNPHRLNANELEESFIARQELFQSILDDLASGKPKSSPQHHLVGGQRGMGKTTLLRRVALELHREPHCQRLLPLNFPEEQYIEVDRLSKFWLNCLDATADALEYEGKNDVVAQIDEEVKRLSQMQVDETSYHEACREAFTAVWKQLGRRPVLFIDNFNLLLSRLRKEDYSLRGYFSAPGAPVLVAASTVYPEEMADYGAAFYDGFKPHYLHPLTLEEVRDVLILLAQSVEKPGLVDRIYQELPRLAALRDLTGGNP
ncbi:MAG: ATP-binding protein, partial [Planctomycetaceae bacterium]|nr:ATP-binding protein [Planctomycetaceae bacterium]